MKRRRVILAALTALFAPIPGALATELEDSRLFPAREPGYAQVLRMVSTTDLSAIRPVLAAFSEVRPDIAVQYDQAGSLSVFQFSQDRDPPPEHRYDLAMSSAMDLQIKLVNDGLARPYRSDETLALPRAMRWRDSVFGFTQEPAAIVYNPSLLPGGALPRTRFALLEYLRAHRDAFVGKIVTYDIRRSGLGYLFATQDSFRTETYWRLMEVFGGLGADLQSSTGAMLTAVAEGRAAFAYNVIAGYAHARAEPGRLEVMLPDDYTLVMIRSVLIPSHANRPDLAGAFIDFLLSEQAREIVVSAFSVDRTNAQLATAQARPIRLDPGLLVFLDRMKRNAFLKEWESAMGSRQAP